MLDSQQPADDAPIDWPAECARILASLTPEEMAARRKRAKPKHLARHLWVYTHEDPLCGGEYWLWHPALTLRVFKHVLADEFNARREVGRYGHTGVFRQVWFGDDDRVLIGQADLSAALEQAADLQPCGPFLLVDPSDPGVEDGVDALIETLEWRRREIDAVGDSIEELWGVCEAVGVSARGVERLRLPSGAWVESEVSADSPFAPAERVGILERDKLVRFLVATGREPAWRLHSETPPADLTFVALPVLAPHAAPKATAAPSAAPTAQPPATTLGVSESREEGAADSTQAEADCPVALRGIDEPATVCGKDTGPIFSAEHIALRKLVHAWSGRRRLLFQKGGGGTTSPLATREQ